MEYPNLRAYMAAIADIDNLNIPFFKSSSMQMYLNRRGVPYMSVGGFGAVFRFKDKQGRQYGLKCFTREVPGRAERYKALHDTLQITKFNFMVDFQYVEDGVKVGENVYPVVVMEWGRGVGLDAAIDGDLEDDGVFNSAPRFAGNLYKVVKTLQEWNMAHNDLQEGNLLIDDQDRITLIDYDGMFVPALEGLEANEIGLADYQHPKRKAAHFSSTIDDFSLLSILLQLAVIDPENWKEHHDDKRLLLRKDDYNAPSKSELLKKIGRSKEPHVKALSNLFKNALKSDPLKIGAIAAIEKEAAIMDWFEYSEDTSHVANYTSIISKVVSLTDDQVDAYEEDQLAVGDPDASFQPDEHINHPGRSEEQGLWGVADGVKKGLIDLFFEEVERTGAALGTGDTRSAGDADAAGSQLNRLKKGVMGLFFEDVPEEGEGTGGRTLGRTAPPPRPKGITRTVLKHEDPDDSDPSDNITQEEIEPPADPGAKEAPVPDWMKKRRRK